MVGAALSIAVSPTLFGGWTVSTDHTTAPAVAPTLSALSQPPSAEELEESVQELRQEVRDLRDERNYLFIALGILVSILVAGSLVGITTAFRSEARLQEAHRVALTGESASQTRAEEAHVTFLDSSQRTLSLVNDTLELAKEASEQAAHTMEARVEASLRVTSNRTLYTSCDPAFGRDSIKLYLRTLRSAIALQMLVDNLPRSRDISG